MNKVNRFVVVVFSAVLLFVSGYGFGVKSTIKLKEDDNSKYENNVDITEYEDTSNDGESADKKSDNKKDSNEVTVSKNISDSSNDSRYFKEKLSIEEMKSRGKKISKKEVKQLLYDEIDEHWDVISKEVGQTDKKKVYALFLGFATRESTLQVAIETGHESGFGVEPGHAYGPLQTAVTAFDNDNESFEREDDVPELYHYKWNAENFYDPIISVHMGVRKFIHCLREAKEEYKLKGVDIVKGGLKGFNTGHSNYSDDDTEYNAHYVDEVGAMAGWYYEQGCYYDDENTWTSDPDVDRSDCWGWWK